VPDYKEMYLIMARAAEKAERILIQAQRECEELYMAEEESAPRRCPPEQASATKDPVGLPGL